MSTLTLIAAATLNRCIGIGGRLPWPHVPDGKHFRDTTMHRPIIMGRKTWESIGHPLPGRRSLVLSRNTAWNAVGAEVFASLPDALAASEDDSPFIIGGGDVYALALPHASRILYTEVPGICHGDAYFPDIPLDEWRLSDVEASAAYRILTYLRIPQP